jgi:cation diffusion facilitator family transporter
MAGSAPQQALTPRYRAVRRVTLVGSAVDLLLGVTKIIVGWWAHSQALVADGIHSLSDLATDVAVLYAAKHSHREADDNHPYGHGRIETLATVGLGFTLVVVAFGIAYDAVRRMNAPDLLVEPGVLALGVAIVSVISKEGIYHYTVQAARKLRSDMLMANAWHSRSDAISSIVVVIGVAGAMIGYPYLDAVAAIAVSVMIAKIAFDLVRSSSRELIDTALDPQSVDAMRTEILAVDGVRALHMLRSRSSAGQALVDVHIQVDPRVSVSEGHQIGDSVRRRLLERIDEVTDVTVHIDPEDDELESPCHDLPLRSDLVRRLDRQWAHLDGVDTSHITLHYLRGRLQVDVLLPHCVLDAYGEPFQLIEQVQRAGTALPDVDSVRVSFYHPSH